MCSRKGRGRERKEGRKEGIKERRGRKRKEGRSRKGGKEEEEGPTPNPVEPDFRPRAFGRMLERASRRP